MLELKLPINQVECMGLGDSLRTFSILLIAKINENLATEASVNTKLHLNKSNTGRVKLMDMLKTLPLPKGA